MVWGVCSWRDIGPLIRLATTLTVGRYVKFPSDHLHLFMPFEHSDGFEQLQHDNATTHASRVATVWLQEHFSDFRYFHWPPFCPFFLPFSLNKKSMVGKMNGMYFIEVERATNPTPQKGLNGRVNRGCFEIMSMGREIPYRTKCPLREVIVMHRHIICIMYNTDILIFPNNSTDK
ncbi:hypothetical protein AVEN_199538-1 [Araneus ventricosus]|uniref:Tc1-like transposase DDE domain-containing protein n=1 Tax=Araneus ventricosus TaxID=182803 RepID=A0A4Y2PDV4_ARAVE|nr:hypothetical protein AVEN_199538-1 [Araneus ventricosus]